MVTALWHVSSKIGRILRNLDTNLNNRSKLDENLNNC